MRGKSSPAVALRCALPLLAGSIAARNACLWLTLPKTVGHIRLIIEFIPIFNFTIGFNFF